MTRQTSFELRSAVTPYVCSTPVDFIQERQFLSDRVFPEISELCRLRGSFFAPTDLRWKPSQAQTSNGLLLKTLLDATKMCSPFFLGLLGETYGPYRDEHEPQLVLQRLQTTGGCDWLDTNFILAGSGGHPWVLQDGYQYTSVTELEVTQGALLCDSPYVTFYFRRSDHLDNKRSARLENGSSSESDLKVYCSESQQAKVKVHDLRQRLVNKGVPVKYFSTEKELGDLVLADWTGIVDMCLPPLLHDVKLLDSIEYREWLAQQSFVKSCSEVFVSTQDLEETLHTLTQFAMTCTKAGVRGEGQGILESDDCSSEDHSSWAAAKLKGDMAKSNPTKSILLLNGGRGVGKSALAVHWLNEFKTDNSHICVISHFVSASSRSVGLVYFLQQCTRSLRKHFLSLEDYDSSSLCADLENNDGGSNDNFLSLCEAFVAAISLGPCVILVDGLNEFDSSRKFDWLPECLPKTCKMIFTTTSSDISYRCLSQRFDTIVINFPTPMADGSTTVAMIRQHYPTLIQLIGGDRTMKRLAQLKIMQTALGSRVTASELVCYRVYSHLDNFMERTEVWSLRDFWTLCVQSWVREYSWALPGLSSELSFTEDEFDYSGWVSDCLCLIAASRNGLTQHQVISILKMIGYKADLEVSNYAWLQFRLAAGFTLRELGDGRLVFGHKYLQEIAEYLYFKSITSCPHDPEAIIRCTKIGRLRLYHTYLARYFSQQRLNVQVMEELPWHFLFSGETTSLVNYLTNWQALLAMTSADWGLWQQDLTLYWSVCRKKGHFPEIGYLQLMHGLAVVDINDLQAYEDKHSQVEMVSFVQRATASTPQPSQRPYVEEGEHISWDGHRQVHRHAERTETLGEMKVPEDSESKDKMEGVFVTQAMSYPEDQSHGSRGKQLKESCSLEVASLGWYLATFLLQLDQREASSILLSSLATYMKQNCQLTTEMYLLLSRCHYLEGRLCEVTGSLDRTEKSFRLALHAVMAAINMDDEMKHQNTSQYLQGLLLSCYGSIYISKNQLSEAEELLTEALNCVKDNSDAVVLKSTIYFHLGTIKSCQCDYQHAERCLRESAKLRSLWFGSCHPLVADVVIAVAKLLAAPNNTTGQNVGQARRLYKQALRIQEKFFGASHWSVGDILFQLGKLLAEENSRLPKEEARECFRRCLDIRMTTLGGNNPVTIATQQRLSRLGIDLQLKNYQSTSSKHTQVNSNRKDFSISKLYKSELLKLSKERRKTVAHSEDRMSVDSVSQDGAKNRTRPDSIVGTVISLSSACDRLLSAPLTDNPRLLWKKSGIQSSPSLLKNNSDVTRRSDFSNILASPAGRQDKGQNKKMAVEVDEPVSSGDETACQVQENGTSRSVKADLSEHTNNGKDQPVFDDLQQNKAINAENHQNHEIHTDVQNEQEVRTDILKKKHNIVKIEKKQPIIVEMQQKQPIIVEMQQKQPIIFEMQQPISAETQKKKPVITENHLNPTTLTEIRHKQPIHAEIQPKQASIINIQHKDENVNGQKDDNWETAELGSYANVMQNTAIDKKRKVLHPLRVTQRLFQGNETGKITDRPQTCTSRSRNWGHPQRNAWSGRSKTTSTLSATSSHLSHCNVPGRHDITLGNTQTITGPFNCLSSLMEDHTSLKQTSIKLHHMSAWYHVPGRFATPKQPYPAKRMQRTRSAKDIEALIAINALKPQQLERCKLTDQERSQIIDQSKKCHSTQNSNYVFDSNSRPALGPGFFLGHSHLFDKQKFSKDLMSRVLGVAET